MPTVRRSAFLFLFLCCGCQPQLTPLRDVGADSLQVNPYGDGRGMLVRDSVGQVTADSGQLGYLREFAEQYPHQVKLLEKGTLPGRLKRLLGGEYEFVRKIRQVEAPITLRNGFFYSWAMQAHSGGDPSAAILVDLQRDVVYVLLIRDQQQIVYSEDGSPAPEELYE